MSIELTIDCPHCGEAFELTEALAGPLLEAERKRARAEIAKTVETERESIAEAIRKDVSQDFAAQLRARDNSIAERDAKLKQAQEAELAARKATEAAERAQQETELTVQRRVDAARAEVAAEAVSKAKVTFDAELKAAKASLAEKDAQVLQAQQAELAARKAKEAAEQAKQQFELDVQRKVDATRSQIAEDAAKKATTELSAQLAAARAAVAEKDAKLVAAQAQEIEARRLKAEAEEAARETELTVARRLDEERVKVREQALREREDDYRLKLGDKDAQLRAMQEKIDELSRKGTQGSQQLVGDVLELDLLIMLQEAFPGDRFERVRKGQRGADVLQTVRSAGGSDCGTILWESKRTKNWNEPWLAKLREDQREAKADLAALATETLPEGISSFAQRDGIWVTALSAIVPVAGALRHGIIEVATARRAGALADSTKDHVFTYLTSPQFRQRITRVTESYVEMRSELDKEKRSALTQFGKREKQLERILGGITGFYGDLQGIVGASLPAVDGLTLAAPQEGAERPKLTVVNSDAGSVPGDSADPLLS
jgi:hypothetical protein